MKKTIYLLAITVLTLASCSSDNPTPPDPQKGQVTLTTDWTSRTAGITIPASYTARVGENQATLSGATNEFPHLLIPGSHTLYVYNTANKISVSGTTATVTTTAGVVEPMPDWFFSGKASVTIAVDKSHDITVVMKQEICQLDITLTVTEGDPARISSVTGTLKGVAGAWNFDTDTSVGDAMSVSPAFTRTGDKITATMRLLGVVPSAAQELTLVVTFSDTSTQTIVKDLSSLLTGFNTNQHLPASITADVHTPIEGGFTCTINNWVSVNRDGVAN